MDGLAETRERQQLELDIHVTLTQALMAGKGYANPETVAVLERVGICISGSSFFRTLKNYPRGNSESRRNPQFLGVGLGFFFGGAT